MLAGGKVKVKFCVTFLLDYLREFFWCFMFFLCQVCSFSTEDELYILFLMVPGIDFWAPESSGHVLLYLPSSFQPYSIYKVGKDL